MRSGAEMKRFAIESCAATDQAQIDTRMPRAHSTNSSGSARSPRTVRRCLHRSGQLLPAPPPASNKVQRNAGWPGDGFVFVPDKARQRGEEIVHADDGLMMIGADRARYLRGIAQFAELRFPIADGEGLDRATGGSL